MQKDRLGHWTQFLVSIAVLAIWGYVQHSILDDPIPEGSRDIMMRAMGILDAATVMVLTYWLGTSRSSTRKDEVTTEDTPRG